MHAWQTGMHEWVNLELVMINVQEDTTITDRGSFYFKTMAVENTFLAKQCATSRLP
jgi:hypothetical protein